MDSSNRNVQRSKNEPMSEGEKRGDKKGIVDDAVRQMFKRGSKNMSLKDYAALQGKYDPKLLQDIYNEFARQYSKLIENAEQFAKDVADKYGDSGKYPTHKIIEKAINFKEKSGMSDAVFNEFKRLYEKRLSGHVIDVKDYQTRIGAALGESPIKIVNGLSISDADHGPLQEILKLHKATKNLYNQVILQSFNYRSCAHEAISGKYDPTKHNPASHVHPVLAAMFLHKIPIFEERFLYSSVGYIIQQKYDGEQIDTRPNYEFYWDLVRANDDVVCSASSPMEDLLNRFRLQVKIWESVLSLRLGQYYGDHLGSFLQAVDNCRVSMYDMPELLYVKDEGTIFRRMLAAAALRPTLVATTPLYGIISSNPYDRMRLVPVVKQVPLISIRFPPSLQRSEDQHPQVRLEDALEQAQWTVENGALIPKSQRIMYSRDVLIFYVNRRYQYMNPIKHMRPYSFVSLPLTTNGYEELNDTPLGFETNMRVNNTEYCLKSVVCVEKISLEDKLCPSLTGSGATSIITGSSAVIIRDRNEGNEGLVGGGDEYLLYNPAMAAIQYKRAPAVYESNTPISYLYAYPPHDSEDNCSSFFTKASTTGTIFIYAKRPKVLPC